MKMTLGRVATIIGAAAAGFVGHLATGRVDHAQAPSQDAQPTISAPAATTADIAALRQHFDAKLGAVEQHLANIDGYLEAKKQTDLQQALSGIVR